MTILTGVKPTGKPHLGNYLGAMRLALTLAKDHHTMIFIADYHALTTMTDAGELRRLTYEVAASWIAAGLDPECVTFYRQSDVPETFELFWLLSCATPKGMMNRAHAYKAIVDENARLEQAPDVGVNMGIYAYPVLMAADILLFDVNLVPVGSDQTQHVEMVRDIARRFNDSFGAILTIPELLHTKNRTSILGVDGRKMSKSHDNAIAMFASSDELRKSLRAYKTDSTAANAPKDPDANGLFRIFSNFADVATAVSVCEALVSGEMTWGKLKKLTFEVVDADIAPMRERYDEIRNDTTELERILSRGAGNARAIARETMRRVHDAVGVASLR